MLQLSGRPGRPAALASAVLALALLGDSLLYAALPLHAATFGIPPSSRRTTSPESPAMSEGVGMWSAEAIASAFEFGSLGARTCESESGGDGLRTPHSGRVPSAYAKIARMRAIVSEAIGTGLLVAAVVGSGIMGERLSGGNVALALLANSIATGAVLVTLIFTFAPISGAHFNPAVTLAAAFEGGFPWRRVPGYLAAQFAGAIAGVVAAHAMFEHPLLELSRHARAGFAQSFSEFLATFGLLVVIHGTGKRAAVVPLTVAAYITAAYWFTSSTSFANPAVTVARGLTDTFSGIQPSGIPAFILAQLLGALAATLLFRWIGEGEA